MDNVAYLRVREVKRFQHSTEGSHTMQTAPPSADFSARISRLEGVVEQMNARLASLESRIAGIEVRMASIEAGQRWIIGIQVTTILSLGTLILVKLG